MAPDQGSLEEEIDLPGTLPQTPCWREEGYPQTVHFRKSSVHFSDKHCIRFIMEPAKPWLLGPRFPQLTARFASNDLAFGARGILTMG